MPSGRDPNQTFVSESPQAAKRGVLIPLLIVGLLVVGGGLLIAWGLNNFFPGLLAGKPGSTPPAAASTPTPGPVAEASPAPTPASSTVMPPIPTPPTVTAVPSVAPTAVAEATPKAPTAVTRPDLRADGSVPRGTPPPATAESTPPDEVFRRAVPPETSALPSPTLVARLEPTPAPRATEPTGPAEAPKATLPPAISARPAAPTTPAAPAAPVDTDLGNPENALIKDEVLKRIDQMPDLTPENRDKLYNRVERTPGMGRIATIFFEVGETGLRGGAVQRLREDLENGTARQLLDDPTVVFVVLGYADKTGGVEVNKRISQARANAAVSAMRNQLGLVNVMHAVAMGASTMFGNGRQEYDKNRVVEVWAVLP